MNGNVRTVIMSEEEFTENVNFWISNWYRDTGSCATYDNKSHIVSILNSSLIIPVDPIK